MNIAGVVKKSFNDYPGNIVMTIFTQGCNLNCKWCHNSELIAKDKESAYIEEKIIERLKKHRKYLDGVCITGGEPTEQKDLITFCNKVKDLNLKIKLDTNGVNVFYLKRLLKLDLIDYVAMDFKVGSERLGTVLFPSETDTQMRLKELNYIRKIMSSVRLIEQYAERNDDFDYEFRTTVVPGIHAKKDIEEVSRLISENSKLYIQNYRPVGTRIDSYDLPDKGFSKDKLQEFKQLAENYVNHVEIRNDV
jgi:pyruvate formate lyase activating enzyme